MEDSYFGRFSVQPIDCSTDPPDVCRRPRRWRSAPQFAWTGRALRHLTAPTSSGGSRTCPERCGGCSSSRYKVSGVLRHLSLVQRVFEAPRPCLGATSIAALAAIRCQRAPHDGQSHLLEHRELVQAARAERPVASNYPTRALRAALGHTRVCPRAVELVQHESTQGLVPRNSSSSRVRMTRCGS